MTTTTYTLAEIRDGTGFPNGARFIPVNPDEPDSVAIPRWHLAALITAASAGDDMESWDVADYFEGVYGNVVTEAQCATAYDKVRYAIREPDPDDDPVIAQWQADVQAAFDRQWSP